MFPESQRRREPRAFGSPGPSPQNSDSQSVQSGKSGSKQIGGIAGLAISAVVLLGVYWVGFGRIDGFAIMFTAFLVLLGAAIEYLPGKVKEAAAGEEAMASKEAGVRGSEQRSRYQRRPLLDVLGVVWLLSIPFAPLFSWGMTNFIDVNLANWKWVLGLRTFLCVIVPVIGALSLLRFIRRGTAGIALAILAIGTGFPVVAGLGSVYDVIEGPAWQSVTIQGLGDFAFTSRVGTHVRASQVFVELADGRTLSRTPKVTLSTGPARVLVLRGIGRVIDVKTNEAARFN